MKLLGWTFVLLLISCRCQHQEKEVQLSDEYSRFGAHMELDKSLKFKVSSNMGLTTNCTMTKSLKRQSTDNQNCTSYRGEVLKIALRTEEYGLNFSLAYEPEREGDALVFGQTFSHTGPGTRKMTFTYMLDEDITRFHRFDENSIDAVISQKVLDSLNTISGTFKKVFKYSVPGGMDVDNPRTIIELYMDPHFGLIRFMTKDGNLWDVSIW